MNDVLAKPIADGIMKLSVSGGIGSSLMGYLNHNAAGLGVVISLFGVIIAAVFYYKTYHKNNASSKDRENMKRNHNRIQELEEKVKFLSGKDD